MSSSGDIRTNLRYCYLTETEILRERSKKGQLKPDEIDRLVSLTRGAKELQQFERENMLSDEFDGMSTEELEDSVHSDTAKKKMGAVE